jgi:hypothetical protein
VNDIETRHNSDDELLDRLVDGELAETERKALLEDLDRRTDGWRRCALAFLEAQTFGTVFREHLNAPAPVEQPTVVPYVAPRRESNTEWGRILAAAASFLIVCSAVMWYRGGFNKPDIGAPLTDVATTMPIPTGPAPAVQGPMVRGTPTEMVSLTMPGDKPGQQQTVQLPLVDGRSVDASALRQPQGIMPQNVVQTLQQMGHQVQQQRQFVPVQLQDGRRVLFSVDQVELRFVGNKDFQ